MNTLRSLIVLHEDKRTKPYLCTAGKTTIGIGRNLTDVGLSEDEIALLFDNDLRRVERELLRAFPWAAKLDTVRYAVLTDMLFNLGIARLKGFKKFLAFLEAGNWTRAAHEMADSLWFRQVKTRGIRLRDMVLTGSWPSK